jgi:hypothetical protein
LTAEQKTQLVGEDTIRLRVAAPDATTVVMAGGGGAAMLAETIKAAKDGGGIGASEGLDVGMKQMPPSPRVLVIVNAGNLWSVMTKAMAVMGTVSDIPPFTILAKTPALFGGSIIGNSIHATVFIPNDLAKDAAKAGILWWVANQSGAGAGESKPKSGAGDF